MRLTTVARRGNVVNALDPVWGIPIDTKKTPFRVEIRGRTYYFVDEQHMRRFLEGARVAYFSMEIGLEEGIRTYSGGLGVLAGDTIKSGSDLKLPMVAVTLVNRMGYFRQVISETGDQLEYPDPWEPSAFMRELPDTVEVRIGERVVRVKTWIYDYQSPAGSLIPILFLDTDVNGNTPEDRLITSHLYGGDEIYRLKQAIVLGIGGVRMLKALNFTILKYHMNEGQSSLLALELLRRNDMDANKTRDRSVFTTHTPVAAAFFSFSYETARDLLGDEFDMEEIRVFAGEDRFNMTALALNLSTYVNGVARAHVESSTRLFPGYHIRAITNGVHPCTWTSQPFKELFDRYFTGWALEPDLLVRIDTVPHEEVRNAHMKAKAALLRYIAEKTGTDLEPDTLTLGFARRMTGYKRATLLFSDLDRLRKVLRRGPIQVVMAGKAHPRDEPGKGLIREIHAAGKTLKGDVDLVFLDDYGIDLAKLLTSGVDVWLNTPLPPYEASGTSGMKAAFNGVVNFSVLDGWWAEGWMEGNTGWAIGPAPDAIIGIEARRAMELDDLYNKLEYLIIPKFYHEKDSWATMMRNSIGKIASHFHTHRMMRRYASEAYL
ncbi:alpha-glucan family phosphorylase [Methanoculleus sp. Wushi-C6]|uniref:Alpha-glucan family phosphorylase n=1 Tax=Methanoculleus caldifontis TaxID=2651577 RepID=A0ABU3X1Z1_9EURY|nr:alpha-glucan family phosphorylase [Methanoculleus sp. Wushi-C6]MDV2481431.1 alpha-glucan family phosphorylase [Methanoculleus sp. Wushi-C6]